MASIYDKASLVMIPSGSKEGKLYSQKPTNGDGDFTFSRSTAATRVNASGNIEKETSNLLLQSNNFGNGGYWNDVAVSVTGGQAGYDGTNDAFLITKQSSSFARLQQNLSLSGVVTMSAYLKAGTESLSTFRLGISDYSVQFRLDNQTILDTGNIAAIDTGIEDVGSGWYRCHATWNVVSTSVVQYYVGWNVSDSNNLYIQDAQVEQGLVAKDYIETTTTAIYGGITDNVPRLDYTDSSCPALLLEPQRTNLLTQGEYFKSWSKTSASVTSNAVTSPEGVQNASKLVEASGSSFHFILSTPTIASGSVTFSFYAKSAERTSVSAFLTQSGNNGANFDLSAGTATAQGTGNTASIESVGDGWYRCVVTNSGSAQVASQVRIGVQNGALDSYVGDGTSGVYIYGAQVEQGSYATSYIPTYGSAVTRNADSYYNNNMASLYDSANGFCLYFEYADVKRGDTAFFDYFSFQQLPNTDTGFRAEAAGTNNLEWRIYTDNIDSDLGFPMRVSNIESKRKVLMKVETTGIKLFADGSLEDSQSGYVVIPTLGTLQPLRSTAQPALTQIKQSLGQILYLPVLSDEECIDLTTI